MKLFNSRVVLTVLLTALFWCPLYLISRLGGAPQRRTGGPFPGELNCTIGCHTGAAPNSGPGNVMLSVNGMPMSEYAYTPGETVPVTVTVTDPDASQVVRGFQITAQAPLGCFQAGEFSQADSDMGVLIRDDRNGAEGAGPRPICPDAVIQYPTHNAPKPAIAGSASFNLNWTAPDVNVGPILFAAAGNAANGNFNNQGDRIYLVQERVVPAGVAPTSAASFMGPMFAANEIVAVFGQGFTSDTEIANETPLPTTLAGVTIEVTDSAGQTRRSPQFFASPGQVNAMIPDETAEGMATMTVTPAGGDPQSTTIMIGATGPGVFAANASGSGPAAAAGIRVDGAGVQTPVAVIDRGGAAVPIDLGPESDQVVLLIFATGVRGAGKGKVQVTMGGETAEVLGFAAQGQFVGLDQINAIIPRSLIGRGEVDVQVIVDGRPANVVTILIQSAGAGVSAGNTPEAPTENTPEPPAESPPEPPPPPPADDPPDAGYLFEEDRQTNRSNDD